MYNLPIVNYKFITPSNKKYTFYHDSQFNKYLTDESVHPVDKDKAYQNFDEYLSNHHTKESELVKIQTFTNKSDSVNNMAKDTIVYTGVISLPENVSNSGGFCENKTKKRICEYYFNQFMKHHKYDKKDWCYYAAEHTNTKHTHLHILIFQPNSVRKDKIVDWTKKSNCMTSKYVRTNTIRFVNAVVKPLNNDLIQQLYDSKHLIQSEFKNSLTKEQYQPLIHNLALEIMNIKGIDGRLQYNQLVHYASIPMEKYDQLGKDKQYINPDQAKSILNKIDSLSDYVINSNQDLANVYLGNKAYEDEMYPSDTKDDLVNTLNAQHKEDLDKELKSNLGNYILSEIKKDAGGYIFLLSPEYRKQYGKITTNLKLAQFKNPKGCRQYRFLLLNSLKRTKKKISFSFKQTISKSYDSHVKEFAEKLKQLEQEKKL